MIPQLLSGGTLNTREVSFISDIVLPNNNTWNPRCSFLCSPIHSSASLRSGYLKQTSGRGQHPWGFHLLQLLHIVRNTIILPSSSVACITYGHWGGDLLEVNDTQGPYGKKKTTLQLEKNEAPSGQLVSAERDPGWHRNEKLHMVFYIFKRFLH